MTDTVEQADVVAPAQRDGSPSPVTEVDVVRRQVDAVAAWHRARRAAEAEVERLRDASREARMDATRRLEVLRVQHDAIVRRVERQLADSGHLLRSRAPVRAVVVHRNAWFAGKVRAALEDGGVAVLEVVENGAEGVGVVVAEQPDLVLVEDVLPMLPGEDVVREARRYAAHAVIAAQVAYSDREPPLRSAGADEVWTRQVPPLEVAHALVARVAARA